MSKLYAEVIPSIRLPKKFKSFDYILPDELKNIVRAGSIVFIPFRKKDEVGLVIKIKEKTAILKNLKTIKSVIFKNILLPTDILKIIPWMNDYLGSPSSLTLKTILPEIPKKMKDNQITNEDTQKILLPKIEKNTQNIINSPKSFFCFVWNHIEEKKILIAELILQALLQNKNILILEPRLKNAFLIFDFLKDKFKVEIEIYHRKLNKTRSYNIWKNAVEGKIKIIISTRAGVFMPIKNLGFIIFDDGEDLDFKSADQNPYYDARTIAALRCRWSDTKLIFLSQVPSLEIFELTKREGTFYNLDKTKNKSDIKIIDISNLSFSENKYISETLKRSIFHTLQKEKKVILFLNRKGESTFVVCGDCGFVWKCKECSRPMRGYAKILRCNMCEKQEDMPLICDHCNGSNIRLYGLGTQKLEKEIEKLFPDEKIIRVDKDVLDNYILKSELNAINQADIIIGTEFLFKNYLHPQILIKDIGLVAIPNAENFFTHPNFRTDERAFIWITKLKKLSESENAKLIIQSFSPENSIINMACGDNSKFYIRELKERKNFLYPPFSVLMKIFSNKKLEDNFLKRIYTEAEKNKINILGPEIKIKNKKKKYSIILKIPKNKTKLIPEFTKLIIDEKYNIDINPI